MSGILFFIILGWFLTAEPNQQLNRLKQLNLDPKPRTWLKKLRFNRKVLFSSLFFALAIWLVFDNFLGIATMPALLLSSLIISVALSQLEEKQTLIHEKRLSADFSRTLTLIDICVSSGTPLIKAIESVAEADSGPTKDLLNEISAKVAVGIPQEKAWRDLSEHKIWGELARDLARATESGTALSQVLQSHAKQAQTIRRRDLISRAKTVGVKSALPLMCCFLPAFILTGVIPLIAGLISNLLG